MYLADDLDVYLQNDLFSGCGSVVEGENFTLNAQNITADSISTFAVWDCNWFRGGTVTDSILNACDSSVTSCVLVNTAVTSGLGWDSDALGNYYLPPDSPYIDAGSTTADQLGLSQYTTQTSQVPEGTSVVDLGFHYPALDANPPPIITSQPASQTVALGASVTFSVTATGAPPLTYQWSLNGNDISGATSSSFTIASVQTTDAGTYAVVVGNPYGSTPSSGATLTIAPPPSITTQPASQTVNLGSAATFSVTATGITPLTYQWTLNATNISGATSSSLTIPSVLTTDAGTYAVVVANIGGSVSSSNAFLTANIPNEPPCGMGQWQLGYWSFSTGTLGLLGRRMSLGSEIELNGR